MSLFGPSLNNEPPVPESPDDEDATIDRAVKSLGWSSVGTLVAFSSSILSVIWLSRLLTPAIIGLSATVLGVSTILRAATVLPFEQGMVTRDADAAIDRGASALAMGFGLLGGLSLAAGGYALELLSGTPYVAELCLVAGIAHFTGSTAAGGRARLQRALEFRYLSRLQVAGSVVGYLVVAPAVAHSSSMPASIVAGAFTAQAVEAFGIILHVEREKLVARRSPDPSATHSLASGTPGAGYRDALKETVGFASVSASSAVALQGDTITIAATLGPAAAGLYSRAYRLMALPANLIGDAIDAVILAAGSQVSLRRIRNTFSGSTAAILLVSWPAALVVAALADDLVLVLLGAKWADATPILRMLCVALPFRVAYKGSALVLKIRRRTGLLTAQLAGYAAAVLGLALIGSRWGVVWSALGVTCALSLFYVAVTVSAHRSLGLPLAMILRDNALGLAIGIPSGVTAYIVGNQVLVSTSFAPVRLLVGGSAGLVVMLIELVLVHQIWKPRVAADFEEAVK